MGQLFSRIGTAHLVALGKITANFSQLEDELCRLIWYLLGPDEQLGQVVTAELSFRGLVNLAGALARHRTSDPGPLQEVEAGLVRHPGRDRTQYRGPFDMVRAPHRG